MESYTKATLVNASRQRVFDALTTADGLRGWWTPIVAGSGQVGTEWVFGFERLDEQIVMRIESSMRPESVRWSCVRHSSLPDWSGTTIVFELVERDPDACEIRFQHLGLTPALECFESCELGWDHFLASITALVEDGAGSPYRWNG